MLGLWIMSPYTVGCHSGFFVSCRLMAENIMPSPSKEHTIPSTLCYKNCSGTLRTLHPVITWDRLDRNFSHHQRSLIIEGTIPVRSKGINDPTPDSYATDMTTSCFAPSGQPKNLHFPAFEYDKDEMEGIRRKGWDERDEIRGLGEEE